MSYGTRKAIAGTMKGAEQAKARAADAVTRLDAARSVADVRAVLAWAKGFSWFLCPGEDYRAMRAAFDRAAKRVSPL